MLVPALMSVMPSWAISSASTATALRVASSVGPLQRSGKPRRKAQARCASPAPSFKVMTPSRRWPRPVEIAP
jgi:hypothetical protein